MTTIAAMFQAYMTICMMDGYGNLYSCKTFTPKEGASISRTACEKKIKEFEGILRTRMVMPYATNSICKDKPVGI